ncbi:succinyl-CoA synthetase-like protein [Lasiosphaeria miniovina]|uniref:Succinyl-CoA synthetase-like protein n=1 Tax=Lasiosphaeria miniovina TaxID=1954250 RepID=A0AA39ZUE0_9PEZI|nr:succinyl-CoA synthetase-like protein [Lasiosphaeria miniovina]KAK0703828.1 succinyl-CoA synthetase-like protein [Lasiosphaeria miniovina]
MSTFGSPGTLPTTKPSPPQRGSFPLDHDGTKIVGGVTPGREGFHLGLPVLPALRQAMEQLKPDATAIYVAARHAAAAIEEAIEGEVPLIVAVAEHIPLNDMLRIQSILKIQSRPRLVDPNSPSIISATGRCRIGFQPLSCFSPGRIGIVAKSGTLSYETVASTTRAGLGQSLCIGVGGDILPGIDLRESLAVFEQDGDTDAIALVGEIGGTGEIDAESWIRDHPEKFGEAFKARLDALATRGQFHLDSRIRERTRAELHRMGRRERRHMFLAEGECMDLLRASGETSCGAGGYSGHGERCLLAIGIDRSARSPCVIAAPTTNQECLVRTVKRYSFDFGRGRGPSELDIRHIAEHMQLRGTGMAADSLRHTVDSLTAIFYENEAFLLTTHIVVGARFGFHDAAFPSGGRQGALHTALAATSSEHGPYPEVQRSGIVYIRLAGDGAVGTVVNGAGLAMNTVDALQGNAASFLDTGGKATSDTVKASFEMVLRDPRVRVVFVNTFGGLKLGDMIVRGIILAFQTLSLKVPVVVRIRGTKEKEGQQLIAESRLPLYAFNDFDEAAAKAVELSMRKPGS